MSHEPGHAARDGDGGMSDGAGPAAAWVEYQMLVNRLQDLHYRDSNSLRKTTAAVVEIDRARRALDVFVLTLIRPENAEQIRAEAAGGTPLDTRETMSEQDKDARIANLEKALGMALQLVEDAGFKGCAAAYRRMAVGVPDPYLDPDDPVDALLLRLQAQRRAALHPE